MMNRREALRLLAGGAALQLAPAKMVALLREARGVLGAYPAVQTLNSHQGETLKVMAEMILPRTETPGATDVGATEFIDLMLTEWYEESDRKRFLSGLADVDARTQHLFHADFIHCNADRQAETLNALGEEMLKVNRAFRDLLPLEESVLASTGNFYLMLRWLTLTAYFTSEDGATQALHFEIIPGRYDGCAPAQEAGATERP